MDVIDIKKRSYSIYAKEGTADITMYGDVVESQPRDWWTDQPIEGNFIVKDEFIKDLERLSKCKKIKLHIDSFGGDASASLFIHNKLREIAKDGTKLEAVIDGVAMSAATHIACACDTVSIPASALFMIHKCWGLVIGGYNADELRDIAKSQDAWDKAQIEIYKRKTKLDESELEQMMSECTYMTGEEAVAKGFCDKLVESKDMTIAASADRRTLFANGRILHLAETAKLPDSIPTVVTPNGESIKSKEPGNTGREGGNIPMANNLKELRAENPELATTIEVEIRAEMSAGEQNEVQAAVTAERDRLSQIDEIAHLFDAETVREAKYGEKPCSAQQMTYLAAVKASKAGSKFMSDVKADFKESGAGTVPPAADPNEVKPQTREEKLAQARANIKKLKEE